MPRIYRDHEEADRRPGLAVILLIPVFMFGLTFWHGGGFTRGAAEFLTVVTAGTVLLVVGAYRYQYLGICLEIRLEDDGSCELDTRRRTIRLHSRDIYAVRYSAETDETAESYQLRFKD